MALRMGIGLGLSRSAMLPALSLGFLGETLDPRITFSRGSNATLVDATGKIVYAPANLLLQSQTFDNAAWTKSAGSITATTVLAPDGTNTADTFTTIGDGFVTQGVSASASTAYIGSVWLRVSTGTRSVSLFRNDNGTGFSTTSVTVTTTWQRFTLRATSSATATIVSFQVGGGGSLPNGTTIEIWGAQLEPVTYQTTPSTYVATTASAYYGPRFDYDPVTLAPKGLLIEEARTNLLTYSQEFDNAAWADAAPTSTVTVAANNTTAPDGTSAADKLTAATGGTNAMARQAKTLVASTAYTGSIFVKASTSTQSRLLLRDTTAGTNFADATLTWTAGVPTVAGGSVGTWAIVPFGNGWYRVTGTGTSGATASPLVTFSIFPDTAAGTNAIFVYGAQLEAGSFATSYIPTVASQVTRTADVATMTGTNFSSWFNPVEGTFVVDADTAASTSLVVRQSLVANDGTSSNYIRTYTYDGRWGGGATAGAVLQADFLFGAGTVIVNTPAKVAIAVRANDFAVCLNGGTVLTDTSGTVPTVTQLSLGQFSASGNPINGHIRSIAYYNTRLPNAQLQALTA